MTDEQDAISTFTKALAIEEAKNRIRVDRMWSGNIISRSRTDLESKINNSQAFPDYVETWEELGQGATIEEVGHAYLLFASDSATFITGIEVVLGVGAGHGFGMELPVPMQE